MAAAIRVVQWATGNIGTHALRSVIDHPDLELVGVYVYGADKEERDAGELCGRPATGVLATRDEAAALATRPDCVLYMAARCDFDQVVRILESGANVVTTRGEFHWPAALDPAMRARIESACERGRTSIYSTGSSPGFITEALPLVLTSIQRRLDGVLIEEFADLSRRDSPDLLFHVMGFGQPPTGLDERRVNHGRTSFGPSLQLLADALSIPLDSLEASGEVATARRDTSIAAGQVAAGTVAAQRITVAGLRNGREVLRFRAVWYCTTDIEADWDVQETGWRVRVDGDAPLDIDIRFPVPTDRMGAVFPGYTANRAVNAVPIVCAAHPGIRTTVDLPQVIARLS